MDPSQRANAAQMAARKIKEKPKRRPGAGSVMGRPESQAPQFPSMPSQNGGGLFGGNLPGGGGFDFTAPAGPSISFGSPSPATSENGERFEGDDRAIKRQFGGSSTIGQSNPFQTSSFGQSQPANPFASANQQQPAGSSIFSFGATQPQGSIPNSPLAAASNTPFSFSSTSQPAASTPFNFGSGSNENKPASNLFNFGGPSTTQPQGGSSIFAFGSPASQDKPATTPFQFGQSSTQPTSSGINFGSTSGTASQEKPVSTPFQFGQTSAQLGSSSMNFGSASATVQQEKPATALFQFGQSSGIDFGSTPATASPEKSSSSPFKFGQSPAHPSSSSTSFGAIPATASNEKSSNTPFQLGQSLAQPSGSGLFGSAPAGAASPTSNFSFGSVNNAAPSTTGFSFGASTLAAPATSSTLTTSQSATSNLFSSLKPKESPQVTKVSPAETQTPSTSTNFNKLASSSNNIFSEPKESPAPTSQLFGGKGETQASNNIFGQAGRASTTSPLFGAKTADTTPINSDKPAQNLFNVQAQQAEPSSNLFGAVKETSPANNPFGTLNKPLDPSLTQSRANGTTNTSAASPSKSTSIFNTAPSSNPFAQPKPLFSAPEATSSLAKSNGTPAFSFGSIQSPTPQSPPKNDVFSALKPVDAPAAASQPPPSGMFPSLSEPAPTPRNATSSPGLPPNRFMPATISNDAAAELYATRDVKEEDVRKLLSVQFTEEDRQKFMATYRITLLNKAMQNVWGELGDRDPKAALEFYNEERNLILSHYSTAVKNLKRKATEDQEQEDENPSKRAKQGGHAISTEPASKRKMTDENEENQSPNKRSRQFGASESVSLTNGVSETNGQPILSPSKGLLPGSNNLNASPSKNLAPPPPTPSPSKSKRKATEELTQNTEQLSPLRREMKTPNLNGSATSPRPGSQTSNMFKSILDSPSDSSTLKSSSQKASNPPEKPKDEGPRFNPFGVLPIPKSPTKATASLPSPNTFTAKAQSSSANSFAVKPPAPTSSTNGSDATAEKSKPMGMPRFLAPSITRAQFQQKAKQTEEEELEKAREEDMDSDEDPEEFDANWRRNRAAKAREVEEIAKSSQVKFGGQGFTFIPTTTKSKESNMTSTPAKTTSGSTDKALDTATTGSKQLFGQNASSQGSGNSVFSSLNGSRDPTPGPVGSSTGSVLDGHTPGKVISFGGNNIFGHLSDADSGKGDDDSAHEESDAEDESEKKDPNYMYKPESESGPGTPPEKTGDGIASAKKPNPFGVSTTGMFGSSASETRSPGVSFFGHISTKSDEATQEKENGGATTPGGSLFDRITKDSNGNPLRVISTEEKENTQPSSSNIFGNLNSNPFSSSFNKSAPVDQTWKPDSPIKFGSPSSEAGSAPTVNVTAATPTKSGSPSNIFSEPASTTPVTNPFANLFGSKTDPKPTPSTFPGNFGSSSVMKPAPASVGFGFGTPTNTSSLLPSAAGSANTSRATSPGATTDGDSGADADPDAERHEQIDLTAGGPGEEEEEVVHEVRAKALKFSSKADGDNSAGWDTKGVGPLRILKHKETKASRILMRADPSGTIVLNKNILGQVKYESNGKTLKLLTASDAGKGLETWMLQVKTPEFAEKLAEVLEENKASL